MRNMFSPLAPSAFVKTLESFMSVCLDETGSSFSHITKNFNLCRFLTVDFNMCYTLGTWSLIKTLSRCIMESVGSKVFGE